MENVLLITTLVIICVLLGMFVYSRTKRRQRKQVWRTPVTGADRLMPRKLAPTRPASGTSLRKETPSRPAPSSPASGRSSRFTIDDDMFPAPTYYPGSPLYTGDGGANESHHHQSSHDTLGGGDGGASHGSSHGGYSSSDGGASSGSDSSASSSGSDGGAGCGGGGGCGGGS